MNVLEERESSTDVELSADESQLLRMLPVRSALCVIISILLVQNPPFLATSISEISELRQIIPVRNYEMSSMKNQ